jgi:hypothetical protein
MPYPAKTTIKPKHQIKHGRKERERNTVKAFFDPFVCHSHFWYHRNHKNATKDRSQQPQQKHVVKMSLVE